MGHVGFCGLAVATRPGVVMTPRRASEHVVETALAVLGDRPATVADVGTGSGAIAVALAAGAPRPVCGQPTRAGPPSPSPARTSAATGSCTASSFSRATCSTPSRGPSTSSSPNLPYLPAGERDPDLAGEPSVAALYAPGDGLGPYRRLLDAAAPRLSPTGALIVQFHRRVLLAHGAELDALRRLLEDRAAA